MRELNTDELESIAGGYQAGFHLDGLVPINFNIGSATPGALNTQISGPIGIPAPGPIGFPGREDYEDS